MGEAARTLFEMAMALSDDERRELVAALVAVDPSADAAWQDAWAAEIERRVAADPEARESIAWADVLAGIRSDLEARRR